jgi:DNA polymerase III sliding clamp (beta) subunit (PCNA family)
MKKITKTNSGEAYMKKASGGEITAYEPIRGENITLSSEKNDSSNVIEFPTKLNRIAEFQINDDALTRDDFNRILFVSKALSRDRQETRLFKTLIHIELSGDKRLVIGSDGYRLHAVEVDLDLLPGNYSFRQDKHLIALGGPIENDNIKYPDWERIMPSDAEEKLTVNFDGAGIVNDLAKLASMSHKMYSLIKKTNKLINLYFLNDLSKTSWKVSVSPGEKNTPVVFSQDIQKKIFALIMPMNPEED